MEILPSKYKDLDLKPIEKKFVDSIESISEYGYFILNCNPSFSEKDFVHILLCQNGIIIFKFIDDSVIASFPAFIDIYMKKLYPPFTSIIAKKLINNHNLIDENNVLKLPINVINVFPETTRKIVNKLTLTKEQKDFTDCFCLFKEELNAFKDDFKYIVENCLKYSVAKVSKNKMSINDENVSDVISKLAPEYTFIKFANSEEAKSIAGVSDEELKLMDSDLPVKAFRLDSDQINLINRISKGNQLILACAGSGKSVLLIAKCFKAAAMNPDKEFLITCYNNNLCQLYNWFIDHAGLPEKNVKCFTFHKLCKFLIEKSGYKANSNFDTWFETVAYQFGKGNVKNRFYGIFIDEVQEFKTDWYKLCFNLLENKSSDDHLFVICGDKTQKIKNDQKHGRAPWNAGEGYPTYRGSMHNIRIEKNYRNCSEINEFLNAYLQNTKNYLDCIDESIKTDTDMFLRGSAQKDGYGVKLKTLATKSNDCEADEVFKSIRYIHDNLEIPYDEIAVIMNNGSFKRSICGWKNRYYSIESPIKKRLDEKNIPYVCISSSSDNNWASRYGCQGGVKLAKIDSVLGLDYRAVIVCGLVTLGEYNSTKSKSWETRKDGYEEAKEDVIQNFCRLYVACSRARDILHVIVPESSNESIYAKMLNDSKKSKTIFIGLKNKK